MDYKGYKIIAEVNVNQQWEFEETEARIDELELMSANKNNNGNYYIYSDGISEVSIEPYIHDRLTQLRNQSESES